MELICIPHFVIFIFVILFTIAVIGFFYFFSLANVFEELCERQENEIMNLVSGEYDGKV